ILRTTDGGKSWKDEESPSRANLFAVQCLTPDHALAAGELGTLLLTEDAGKTWAIQPNITSKVLQAIVYRGGNRVWMAGRGGTIMKRTEPLAPVNFTSSKGPPVLRPASMRIKPKSRTPLVTITDDGDIPMATPPASPKP